MRLLKSSGNQQEVSFVSEPILMKGNEAIAEAAIRSRLQVFLRYPITPQNEIPEYMSKGSLKPAVCSSS